MWCPQQELNLCLRLRRRPFFPLNYAGKAISMSHRESGDPWGIRTPDGLLDREVLYQAELTGQKRCCMWSPRPGSNWRPQPSEGCALSD